MRYGNATDGFGETGNLSGKSLNMKGLDVEAGARGGGTSLYFEDPNGHSVEIMTYDERARVWVWVSLPRPTEAAMRKKPNILFLMAGQLAPQVLQPYGGPVCRTPYIERLAGITPCAR